MAALALKSPPSSQSNYRPDIDGLRAIAVLAVVFGHAKLGFSGGYVGVDVFFVISGYLITQLIVRDLEAGAFSLAKFWERRIRRIMPAMVVMVVLTWLAGWLWLLPEDFILLGRSVLAQAAMVSNYYFYTVSGYFAPVSAEAPLLHTWSLAVEEQFYVLFPVLLFWIYRWSKRAILPCLSFAAALSFGWAIWWSHSHAWANYYFLPTRAWELLLGACLACRQPRFLASSSTRNVLSVAGLVAILWAMLSYDQDTGVPGIPALLPCGGAALIIAAGRRSPSMVGRLLAFPPLVFVGLISYSLYLWHWPLLVLSQYLDLTPLSTTHRWLLVLASVGLAVLSWRWVETPFRQRACLPERRHLFLCASAATTLVVALGLMAVCMEGIPWRHSQEVRRFADGTKDRAYVKEQTLDDALNERFAELGAGDTIRPVHVLVWGDSHAMAVMPAIDQLCRDHRVRGIGAAHSATAPLLGYSNEKNLDSLREDNEPFNQAILRFILKHRVKHVLMVARWDGYLTADKGDITPLLQGVVATLNALKDSGARLWLMSGVPVYQFSVPKHLAFASIRGWDVGEVGMPLASYHGQSAPIHTIFAEARAQVRPLEFVVLDPETLMTGSNENCLVAVDGYALYRDGNHLSVRGAHNLLPLFAPIFTP